MSEVLLKEISKKLDVLIAMFAIQGKDIKSQIKILKSLGYSNVQVGKLVGMSETNVRAKLKNG